MHNDNTAQALATPSAPSPPGWAGSAAGVAGAAVALGFGELVEGVSDTIPSLVVAVGELVTDYTPGDLVAVSIDNLGNSQKSVLTFGIIVTALLLGGALGRHATRRPPTVTQVGFAVFGVIGGWAAARNPFSPALSSWLVALTASALGMAVTVGLARRAEVLLAPAVTPGPDETAPTTPDDPGLTAVDGPEPTPAAVRKRAGRRAFFAWAGGAAASALALWGIGRRLRGPSAAETARESITLSPRAGEPAGEAATPDGASAAADASELSVADQVAALDTLDEIDGIASYISPNDGFYRIDTALTVPQIDPANWRLRFTGMIDSPYELDFDEILAMELSDYVITLSCVSNSVGGNLVGNAVWTGVPLAGLLERAGVQPGATQVVGRSVDDWTAGFPTEVVHDGRNAILAVGMNGEPLPTRHGFPARLVVAGLYGYVSAVKWIEEIHLTTWDGFDAYWVPRGWSKEGPMKTQSRIDVAGGDGLRVGAAAPVAGVAWAPTRGIAKVEVRIGDSDGDGEWTTCQLGEALGDESWVQWQHQWTPSRSGRHRIQVRATDGDGETQSPGPVPPRPNGAEGWHTVDVNVSA